MLKLYRSEVVQGCGSIPLRFYAGDLATVLALSSAGLPVLSTPLLRRDFTHHL